MDMMQTFEPSGPLSADEIAAAMAGEDLDLENLGLHGGYGNISATIAEILYDHSYNLGSHTFRCNSSRVGGFPLEPSDMPSQVAKYSRTTSNQGSLSSGYVANTVGLNSVDSDIGTNWSFSGGVATCLNAGVYDLVAQLGYSSQEGGFVINHNGNAIGVYYYSSANSLLFGNINIPGVSVGAGDTIKLEFFSGAAAGVIYYTYTGFPTTVPDKHATWLRMTRRQ